MITKHFKARPRLSIPACGLLVLLLVAPALPVSSAPAVSAAAVSAAAAPGAVIAVTTQGDEFGGPGLGCSLREAIQAANTDSSFGGCAAGSGTDTITLPAGTYTLTGAAGENANASGDLDITSSLTIQGAGSKTTFIQAGTDATNGVDRVLHVHNSASVEINGVTIRYGKTTDGVDGASDSACNGVAGGGIYTEWNTTLTLNDCAVTHNHTGDGGDGCTSDFALDGRGGPGGGIYTYQGTLELNDTVVSENVAGAGGDGAAGSSGHGGGKGGGIYLDSGGAEATLTRSTVISNITGAGGNGGDVASGTGGAGGSGGYGGGIGIYSAVGSLTLIESTVAGNTTGAGGAGGDSADGAGGAGGTSGYGAGIANYTYSTLVMFESAVYDNATGPAGSPGSGTSSDGSDGRRGSGGGVYSIGNATLNDTTIKDNDAQDGGGLYSSNNGTATTLDGCTLSGNTAESYGGGICNESGATVMLTNSTISGNGAYESGGGIYNGPGAAMALTHVTLAYNTADLDDDGSGAGGGFYTFGALTITNTLVAKNIDLGGQNPDCYGTITSRDYNLIGIGDSAGCTLPVLVHDQVGTAASPLNPVLSILSDNGGPTLTHAMKINGPAANQIPEGVNGCIVGSRDQRGVLRLPLCDIGAYEIDPETVYLPLVLKD
ncbi:MAG: CSLREA domain-containing protein [Anaerolineae bacterium]|nr:CSLREA domain-containing protein [Anaerolineae bacterium]